MRLNFLHLWLLVGALTGLFLATSAGRSMRHRHETGEKLLPGEWMLLAFCLGACLALGPIALVVIAYIALRYA